MVTWGITTGLVLTGFLIPFALLRGKIGKLKRKLARTRHELECLRLQGSDLARRLEEDKSLFLEALGVPFVLARPSGRLLMANAHARELLGLGARDSLNLLRVLEGTPLADVLAPALGAQEATAIDAVFQAAAGPAEERNFRIFATPLHNSDNGVGLVFHDMTTECRAIAMRRDFVANASHELRTPLTIIRGYLENLLEEPELADDREEREHILRLMTKHTQRIVRIVEDMLTISRLENPEASSLQCKPFDLREAAADVASRLESLCARTGAAITLDIPSPFLLTGDLFYWTQILFNLMENAVKQNPDRPIGVIVRARYEGDWAHVSVADDGIGIPAEHLPFIFNRFYRVTGQNKLAVKGTGLGLSIVRRAVEAHGGEVQVASEPGKRTAFTIRVPSGKKPVTPAEA